MNEQLIFNNGQFQQLNQEFTLSVNQYVVADFSGFHNEFCLIIKDLDGKELYRQHFPFHNPNFKRYYIQKYEQPHTISIKSTLEDVLVKWEVVDEGEENV